MKVGTSNAKVLVYIGAILVPARVVNGYTLPVSELQ